MKLELVRNSRMPLPGQMLRMAKNLQTLYGKYCHVSVDSKCYSTGYEEITYGLYITDITGPTEQYKDWKDLMLRYRDLIKEKTNVKT